jgi:hypothetical protein
MFSAGFSAALSALLFLSSAYSFFLPTIIAMARHHRNKLAIFLVNLLLGWTGVGWLAALIWALVG